MIQPPFVIEEHVGVSVLRDDLVPGGTKSRLLPALLSGNPATEYVYASPVYGYAQVALAQVATAMGKQATIFCARRAVRHRLTEKAEAFGALIIEIPVGYMSVVQARAREYCKLHGAYLVPFGLDAPVILETLAALARALPVNPTEVWSVAGSGVLTRGLQLAWPNARFHAIQIGGDPDVGRAQLLKAPERFEQDAKVLPPFPSCLNYDAKAWRFVAARARPGALFWNVAA